MLQIKDISKQYKTGTLIQKALDHVSLNLRDNEFVAILGPSGSGKTTLLNIIGGLDRYDSGDLVINGVSTKKYKDRDWDSYRNHTIGFVFQSYNLIPHQTVLANVELALTISGISGAERRKRAEEALRKVGLGDQMHKKPNQMSGGQMQRVAIARALVNDPDIVLADEPTGALDSDTSVQVMELLKEVAKDRLVVMVTHNPELAEQYATRIVRLKDGHITADSDPVAVTADDNAVHKNLGKASMSLLTALSLSFNNLATKKARTFLVSFAGSIGIIGIALIMSLSNGMNAYIKNIEEETLSEYPLEIDGTSMDLTSMMGVEHSSDDGEGEHNPNTIHEIETVTGMLSNVTTNDLKSLKAFFDSGESGIEEYANAIEYTYDVTPQIYRLDEDGYRQINPDTTLSSMGYSSSSSSLFSSYMSSDIFHVMPEEESLYIDSYDVIAGRWNENSHECVVVLSSMGNLSDLMLYSLGLKDSDELDEMLKAYAQGETVDKKSEAGSYDPEDLVGLTFKLVNTVDYYKYDEEYNLWTDKREDKEYMTELIENGETLTITGVVKIKEDAKAGMLTTGIAYSPDLITDIVRYADQSEIVKAQKADKAVNVLTGKPFGEDDDDSSLGLENMFSIDEDMLANAFKIDTSALENAFSGMTLDVDLSSLNMGDLIDPSAFSNVDMSSLDLSTLLNNVKIEVNEDNLKQLFSDILSGYTAYAASDPSTDYAKLGDGIMQWLQSSEGQSILSTEIQNIISSRADQMITTEDISAVITAVMSDYGEWAEENGYTDSENYSTYLAAYLQTERAQNALSTNTQALQEKLSSLSLTTEEVSTIASDIANGYTSYAQANNLPDVTKLGSSFSSYLASEEGSKLLSEGIEKSVNTEEIEQQLASAFSGVMTSYATAIGDQISQAMEKMITELMSQISSSMSGSMSSISSAMENIFSVDADAFANAIHMNMDETQLQELMMSMMGSSVSATYDSTIKSFGSIDLDDPATMLIYPKDFESKDHIKEILEQYNTDMEESGHDEKVITYTDIVGTLMSSVTDIVNSISYVLIAFVAISLVVSSIMIGVITYISVLERRKEIGILRAIGASKHNISQVFNAETFIIGLLAGLIGIGISLLLLIPGNALMHSISGRNDLNAYLPAGAAIGLILLSIILTCIGGLFPARKASKQDPVTALRTE